VGIVTCPKCNYTGKPFGPAEVFIDDERFEYVNCRRCGAMLLVGRDVEL
jgi:predicted nucleic-acid-binding Zn-ribbon protein